MSRRAMQLLCGGLIAVLAGAASAQSAASYPNKPVRVINPFAAGGTGDMLFRPIAQDFTRRLGQSFIIDSRPGGDSIIGTSAVAKAAADGYTLLIASDSIYQTPTLHPDVPYDTLRDFAVIAGTARNEAYLTVHPSVPANDAKELVAYAKANPGKLNMGVGSPTTYIRNATFMQATGTTLTLVNYKGGAPTVVDLLANTIQVVIFAPALVEAHVKAGKLKALAITGDKRNPSLPDVPTLAESGIRIDLGGALQFPLLAPARTPADIIDKLDAQMARSLADPEVAGVLIKTGFNPSYVSSAQANKLFASELERYTRLMKSLPKQ